MIYRSLLSVIKLIDENIKYSFAYWSVRFFYVLNKFNLAVPPLPSYPVKTMNLKFPNPVGLAAGFEREGKMINRLNTAGFGFIEVGTINVDSEAEIEDALNNIIQDLEQSKNHFTNQALLGISIGSLRNSIDDQTVADYLHGMEKFWNHSDYIVINLSRPGSTMRSEINKNAALHRLLEKIKHKHTELCQKYYNHVPLIIKVAIEYEKRKKIPETLIYANELEFDGLLLAFEHWPLSSEILVTVKKISAIIKKQPLIVVGGIKTADDMLRTMKAGADLIQCYTAFVEQGPIKMKKTINQLSKAAKNNL